MSFLFIPGHTPYQYYPYLHFGTTAPQNPGDGTLWMNTATKQLSAWDNALGAWVLITGGGGGGGGVTLPPANRLGQALVAGPGPTFTWRAGDLDEGRF